MKKTIAILFSVLLLLSLCACGASQNSKGDSYYAAAPAEMPAAEPQIAWDEEAAYGGFAVNGSEMKTDRLDAPEAEKPEVDPEKIIYSADATVETTEFEQTLEKLQALVQQVGGFRLRDAALPGDGADEACEHGDVRLRFLPVRTFPAGAAAAEQRGGEEDGYGESGQFHAFDPFLRCFFCLIL